MRCGRNDSRESTLVLENVLHIPKARFNGFNPALYGAGVLSFRQDGCQARTRRGRPLWYSELFLGPSRLVLAGDPQGESQIRDGETYWLSVYLNGEQAEKLLRGT